MIDLHKSPAVQMDVETSAVGMLEVNPAPELRLVSVSGNDGHPAASLPPIEMVPFCSLRRSPENDDIYGVVGHDADFERLLASVRKHGVLEPLVITQDDRIVSGHRRYAACDEAGIDPVPCRRLKHSRSDFTRDEYLKLLAEHNSQRVKTNDQALREELVNMTEADAYADLQRYRAEKSQVRVQQIRIRGSKRRCDISDAKAPFLQAVKDAIDSLSEFWPLSDRQIHYKLLNCPPLRHANKPHSRYQNDRASYQDLTGLVTRARLTGEIPFEAIADPTRPVDLWARWPNPQSFVRDELADLFRSYYRDLMQSQPNHVEIVVEKNTVHGIVRAVAWKYRIPVTSGRGYCSLEPRYNIAERYKSSGKDKLILLIASDFDPDGQEIAHSFARSMVDDFSIPLGSIVPVQVALTLDQVKKYGLQPNMEAKKSSSNYERFVREHGRHAYELEALDGATLQEVFTERINRVIDIDAFNVEADKEKQDSLWLEKKRATVKRALSEINREGSSDEI